LLYKKDVFNEPKDFVHVKNGVIKITNGSPTLIGFSPKLISRNSVPIDYVPKANCPRFIVELLKPLPEADSKLLQKLFGMYIYGINMLHKITILEGASGAGKSQLAIVARELIGEHNCAELRVKHLDDRFEIARFLGKSLLMGADVSGDFL